MYDEPDNTSPERQRDLSGWGLTAVVIALISVAWLVYRPDRSRPFHVVDFAEFMPLLETGGGALNGFLALVEYYGDQGRFNVFAYALLAAKYDLLGWSVTGWQIARAMVMVLAFGLTFKLLRRIGASRLGGLVGASVFFWAPSAVEGWIRLTMGEPLGVVIGLVMAIRATRYQASPRWRIECGILVIGTAALILTKELLAPLLVLPFALALTKQADGRFAFPTRSARNTALLAAVSIAVLATMLPVAVTFLTSDDSAYASLYGRGLQSPAALIGIWITGLVPFDLIVSSTNAAWLAAVCAFIFLLSVGWRIGMRSERFRNQAVWLLSIALILPLVGVLAYLPSPWFLRFYMLPYLIGAALLTGMAATYIQAAFRSGAAWAGMAWLAMAIFALTTAGSVASRTDAIQRRDESVVAFVSDSSDADTVYFATTNLSPADWLAEASTKGAPRGLGATLYRFALATKRPWPPTLEATCESARDALSRSNRIAVVNLENTCDFGAHASRSMAFAFRRVDWGAWRVSGDSARARVLHGRVQKRGS